MTRYQDTFSWLRHLFLNLLFKNNFGLGAFLVPCTVPELQKPSHLVWNPVQILRNCDLKRKLANVI
jgi:hypothetical protein